MKTFIKREFSSQYNGIYLFLLLFLSLSIISRFILLGYSFGEVDLDFVSLMKTVSVAVIYDLSGATYFIIPFVLYTLVVPRKFFNTKIHKTIYIILYTIAVGLVVFNVFGEWFFWDEFKVRYNFIAVDYLVYTSEVLNNIWESYPMHYLIAANIIITFGVMFFIMKKKLLIFTTDVSLPFMSKVYRTLALWTIPILSILFLDLSVANVSPNQYNKELSKNGIYALFAAFRSSELDYNLFYKTNDNDANFKLLKSKLATENSQYIGQHPYDIKRKISATGSEKPHNVIFITIESLSYYYLTGNKNKYRDIHGGNKDITPYLDQLTNESVFFSNLYANGTRTVRGIEALTTAQPPSPGRSIVKKPSCENMFTIGQVFAEKGYENKFLYGGYGYFDNMNYYFSNNGFDIVDLAEMEDEEVTFTNAWGACDEDMFGRLLRESDKSYANNQPFFNFMLTVTNHRPFTYPDGKVSIPSGESRHGAIQYTDYAIQKFMEEAKKKPWFDNTIFVIVADHCAGSAGSVQLPIHEYQIPLWIYAPSILTPQKIDKLCSQVDIAPTLFQMLNWSYESKFYGKDILTMRPDEERAFIGTYQSLGYIKNDTLTILLPKKEVSQYTFDRYTSEVTPLTPDTKVVDEAVAYYQSAYYLYVHKMNRRTDDYYLDE